MSARRGRGEGSIFKNGRGRWVAKIRYTRSGDVLPNQGALQRTFARQRDAIEALPDLKVQAEKLAAQMPGVEPNEAKRFEAWANQWHEERVQLRRIASSTARNEARAKERLIHGLEHGGEKIQGLGSLKLGQINVHVVDRFFRGIEALWINEKDGRLRTRQHAFAVLSKCLRDAKLGAGNPCAAADRPRATAGESLDRDLPVFTPDEMDGILEARLDQYGALFAFLLLTGARIGEALAVQWANVNLKDSTVTIEASMSEAGGPPQRKVPKSRRKRTITMPIELCTRLRALRNQRELMAQPVAHVFCTVLGGPLRQSNVMRREWFPLLDGLKIDRRGFHACRHTHASRLLADGVPITDVAKRLGHASPSVTMQIYSHSLPGRDEGTSAVVDRWSPSRSPSSQTS